MQPAKFLCRIIPAFAFFAVAAIGLSTAASAWTETVLHSFAGGSDGWYPLSNLIMDQSGNLYGTTYFGGAGCRKRNGCGTVFKLAPDGTETVLYAFHGGRDGLYPLSGLVMDSQGNLYGTTDEGGRSLICGTVFELAQDGTETILHSFKWDGDGCYPDAGLVFDSSGSLYGTTSSGGTENLGTVFEFTPTGTYSVLYSFKGSIFWCRRRFWPVLTADFRCGRQSLWHHRVGGRQPVRWRRILWLRHCV